MMMTGRVLLVCALCVLWCGAGGIVADDAVPAELEKENKSESLKDDPSVDKTDTHEPQEGMIATQQNGLALKSTTNPLELEEDMDEDEEKEDGKGKGKAEKDTRSTEQTETQKSLTKDGETSKLTSAPGTPSTPIPPEREGQETPSETPPGPPTNGKPAEETGPPALTGSQNAAETTSTTSPSHSKTAPEAAETPSGNGEPNQHREDAETPDSMKDGPTSLPAETAVSSVSKSGIGGTQKREDKVDDSDQRPNTKEPQDGIEDGNTNVAPTFSETAQKTPETITVAKTNDTTTTGDSDGSTAVSHTTSPLLLLLVVAAAAAAAVVAA
ncbi:Mucin-associated surface protein (MASP) [Trypanosoma cruzi]|uniref:Mucin-associated surface protein (MASP), putative n=2 Tax=Trypanosoma cruzi TaxID=5693 RepID=Q4DXN2_TRYCC|nr:mucin-associated surface protein (MASP), putative [Trypanosoma cruzi]EAN97279.1 mucin-associated surface protein (MASP), putative [Trypanosoma cruzi]PWV09713.1 Mucin-associated surface protein (MASP) [Trypanosoma cruzi]RNC40649.1 mucin-associated surface protein (MASP) [Trypanosoma cruzi]|eukprot:XP_819130.1 mucin-associated surface protein (MASP) [Trypanosoma cruzi strain CL Brener]